MTLKRLIFAVLAVVLAGTALIFLRSQKPAPLAQSPVPVSRGTEPLPPGTKVMPRLEPILETAETIDLEKESARFADFFATPSTAPVAPATSTFHN